MTTQVTDLNYQQRFLLGRITARTQFSQEAREGAMRLAQSGKIAESFMQHGEADQHDQVIIDSIFEIVRISQECDNSVVYAKPELVKPELKKSA